MVTKTAGQRGGKKRASRAGAASSSAPVSPTERRRGSGSAAAAKIRRQTINSDPGHSSEEKDIADKTLTNFSLRDNESFDYSGDSKIGGRKNSIKFKRKSTEKQKNAEAKASQKLCKALDNIQQLFGDSHQNRQIESRIKRQKVHTEKTVQSIKQMVGKLENDVNAAEQIQRQFDQQFQTQAKAHEDGLRAVLNAVVADLNAERKKAHRSVKTFDPNAAVKTLQLMLSA
ncbi:hypothetical protein BJ742DRAFT_739074 [Cladochytrium replicatum]|nr:hypothetical protein BJ742DRAFT_739074 [Cladochytrium replicatum]